MWEYSVLLSYATYIDYVCVPSDVCMDLTDAALELLLHSNQHGTSRTAETNTHCGILSRKYSSS